MKLYFKIIQALFHKYIKKMNTGTVIKNFCEEMGIVYIKLAQILATQNFGNIFNEEDRKILSSICDDCLPIEFNKIKEIIEEEYKKPINEMFIKIDTKPCGSASISQVHKAILKNGDVVAIKVKRKDITLGIEKEIKRIKKLTHRFGKIISLNNIVAGDKALDLYLNWIYQEIDFKNEIKNIKTYNSFAENVNGKIKNAIKIVLPRLYEDLCTKNIIVMEFIEDSTINKLELNDTNNTIISKAINDYFKLSFYALLNNQKVVFHGDPHSGNIYIDKSGNIGFLDMGLIFELSEEDTKLLKGFFFAAYTANAQKLYELLKGFANLDETKLGQFKNDINKYCEKIKCKLITEYFVDMINICLKYEFVPPNFLFCMSKAFICINGINGFSKNTIKATQLLQEQVIEYFIKTNIEDSKNIAIKSISLAPKLIENTYKYGVVEGVTKEIIAMEEMQLDLQRMLQNYKSTLEILKLADIKM